MNKHFPILFISLFVALQCIAQQQKLSPIAQIYLNKNSGLNKAEYNISALVQVNENISENDLKAKGILVQTKAGNIWSVMIPMHVLNDISNIKGIDYLETSLAAKPQMQDTDWIQTKTNLVHQGYNLPKAYKGNGVIVGIIDIGFDYNHPAFYDEQGNCRIMRVWEQNKTGTPPIGYNYGNELTNSTSIKAAITDRISDSHGTMVAGIAAGTGILSKGNANRGMAPNAELVLVGLYYGQETFLDDKNVYAAAPAANAIAAAIPKLLADIPEIWATAIPIDLVNSPFNIACLANKIPLYPKAAPRCDIAYPVLRASYKAWPIEIAREAN